MILSSGTSKGILTFEILCFAHFEDSSHSIAAACWNVLPGREGIKVSLDLERSLDDFFVTGPGIAELVAEVADCLCDWCLLRPACWEETPERLQTRVSWSRCSGSSRLSDLLSLSFPSAWIAPTPFR